MRARNLLILASFLTGAAVAGGACGDSLPSDHTSATTSTGSGGPTTTTTTGATTATSTTGATGSTGSTGGTGGAGGSGTGGAGGAPDCSTSPMTYVEIINACTTAQKIDLMPVLPLLTMDGGLPPLP